MKPFPLILTLILNFTFILSAWGMSEKEKESVEVYSEKLKDFLTEIGSLNNPRAENGCLNAFEGNSLEKSNNQKCIQHYLQVYKKENLDFRVAFGYLDDSSPKEIVDDKILFTQFVKQISSPCEKNVFACGFERDPDDATIFYKSIIDPMGRKRNVTLHANYSSVSTSNKLNTTVMKEQQKNQTEAVNKLFFEGAKTADAIFYAGHARSGGGPDFSPAVRNKNGTNNYKGHYQVKRPGIRKLVEALKTRTDGGPALISLGACDSLKHFQKDLKKSAPSSGYILTTESSYVTDIYGATIGALDSLLGQRCQSDFNRSVVRPMTHTDDNVRLLNFFN